MVRTIRLSIGGALIESCVAAVAGRITWMRGGVMKENWPAAVDLSLEASRTDTYDNHPVAFVNDHVVRISTMTEAYHWHCHPDSDETFLALEGGLLIDLDDRTIELAPGNLFTVERGVRHRTRPMNARSVNLTFERNNAASVADQHELTKRE